MILSSFIIANRSICIHDRKPLTRIVENEFKAPDVPLY